MKKKIWPIDLFLEENLRQTEKVVAMIKKFGRNSEQAREAAQESFHFLRENTFQIDPEVSNFSDSSDLQILQNQKKRLFQLPKTRKNDGN